MHPLWQKLRIHIHNKKTFRQLGMAPQKKLQKRNPNELPAKGVSRQVAEAMPTCEAGCTRSIKQNPVEWREDQKKYLCEFCWRDVVRKQFPKRT